MDKYKQAAIIMLGMGERYAAEIMKGMAPKEVEAIINAINEIDEVTEVDVIQALNSFFKDANSSSGMDIVSKEVFKNSLSLVIESKKNEAFGGGGEETGGDRAKWIDVFKLQPPDVVFSIIQDEHPQVIAVLAAVILDGEKASQVIKRFPKEIQSLIITRMANMCPISTFGMEAFASLFEKELRTKDKYSEITVDGIDAVANIISHLDSDTEREIMEGVSNINKELSEKIIEKILPFERLVQLDKKSIQTLLSEVSNDDLVLALKGSDQHIMNFFLKNMSSKSADILRDELESKGPVKIAAVLEAQKRIVTLAKKLASEEKIVLSTKADSDIVY